MAVAGPLALTLRPGSDSTFSRRSISRDASGGAKRRYSFSILSCMRDDRFWPRDILEAVRKPSLINEGLSAPEATVALPVVNREKPLHAVLCESLVHTKELLRRLEGVTVPRDHQREVVRLLYVATRHQVKALAAVLELEGLE